MLDLTYSKGCALECALGRLTPVAVLTRFIAFHFTLRLILMSERSLERAPHMGMRCLSQMCASRKYQRCCLHKTARKTANEHWLPL